MLKNLKIDPGKILGSVFGKQNGLKFIYFGVDDDWRFHRSVTASLKDVDYSYCGTLSPVPRGVKLIGESPMSVNDTTVMDVVIIHAESEHFSTIIYMCAEGLLAKDGLLCVDGHGTYRFPLFRAMMKENIILPFRQNEFEERGIVVFRKQDNRFSRTM